MILAGATLTLSFSQEGYLPALADIEKNNTTLIAFRHQAEAEALEGRTGIFLQNPEVGINYLWGSPSEIGNRVDISIIQSFDFPAAYKYRGDIASLVESQAMLAYQAERAKLLHEARLICIDLVYYNALLREGRAKLEYSREIALAVEKMYEQGEVNVLELNKALLNLANTLNDLAMNESAAGELRAELQRLNGGHPLNMDSDEYPAFELPPDFDQWFEGAVSSNPVLTYLEHQAEISQQEEKLNRALSLPKFSAGYMSEKVTGEQYQGVSVGMSIPLWENKNSVKAARARTAVRQAVLEDSRVQLYSSLKARHEKALRLKEIAIGYSSSLGHANSAELLKKAYELGEISLIEYLLESQFYYETLIKSLEANREMHKAIAELEMWN